MEDCVIFVRTPEESERVQEVLFAAGVRWYRESRALTKHLKKPFLYVSRGGEFTFGASFECVGRKEKHRLFLNAADVTPERFPPLPKEVIHNVGGKELSESTILAAMKQYVG